MFLGKMYSEPFHDLWTMTQYDLKSYMIYYWCFYYYYSNYIIIIFIIVIIIIIIVIIIINIRDSYSIIVWGLQPLIEGAVWGMRAQWMWHVNSYRLEHSRAVMRKPFFILIIGVSSFLIAQPPPPDKHNRLSLIALWLFTNQLSYRELQCLIENRVDEDDVMNTKIKIHLWNLFLLSELFRLYSNMLCRGELWHTMHSWLNIGSLPGLWGGQSGWG